MTQPPYCQPPPDRLALLKKLWRTYGFSFLYMVLARLGAYGRCLFLLPRKTFRLDEKDYQYGVYLRNAAFRNERVVEIPLALQFFPWQGRTVLEIGNVLSQYHPSSHPVIDKYEKSERVLNIDVVNYNPGLKYDLIVSISTLEHVGWDEHPRDPEKVIRAIRHLKNLLTPEGHMLITVPLGYNAALDTCLQNNAAGFSRIFYMKRISRMNEWVQTSWQDASRQKFGTIYPCANALAIGIVDHEMPNESHRP
jgi:hypothetical protein